VSYFVFTSYGNDSIGLIQELHERGMADVSCIFSDTGWAAPWWLDRVEAGESLAKSYGFSCYRTESEGMVELVKRKRGWPQGGAAAFCTAELKIKPGLKLLDALDPDFEGTCVTGVRRQESRNRRSALEWMASSERHGGRELWQPLVRHTAEQRDELIIRAGFEVLGHRSMECYPCVHANINDLRLLDTDRIALIDTTEKELGHTKKGHPRVMFRPKRHRGATGIQAVVEWANAPRRRDQLDAFDLGSGSGCDSGFCEQGEDD
jgi:3'-phosphoadenosine 5'-phosphosulfate sulfotransferase (PAPS reductase)/FAD synthetase